MQPSSSNWFRNTVLYQIYPRSFYDSNGDGIGDLRGITQRLRYLKGDEDSLGIGAIWLSPFYKSPMADFGYDVSDHCDVDPIFGNLDDFSQLLGEAHKRGIKVFVDLIPNHTSDMHQWFQESKSSRDNPRRNWYTWKDPGPNGGPPNNWPGVFGGSAWTLDDNTGQYFLHSYLKEQPDLNWENAGVREAIRGVMRFWLDMGVDGFRVDAVYAISKDTKFRNDPINKSFVEGDNPYHRLIHTNSKEGPKLFEYIEVMAQVLRAYKDRFMIFEASPATLESRSSSYLGLYENVDSSVSAPFNFEGIHSLWKPGLFREFIDRFQAGMHPSYVPIYCMGNHDQPRLVKRIGEQEARVSAMMQLALPGMPIIYAGDELGMAGGVIAPEDVQDPFELQVPGKGLGRDPERTPLQWSSSKNAGFTSADKPWLPVASDYIRKNVDSEKLDPYSFYNLYHKLIMLRDKTEALKYGSYQSVDIDGSVYCFSRHLGSDTYVVLLNFTDNEVEVNNQVLSGELVLSTYLDRKPKKLEGLYSLRPHEGIILQSL